MIWGGKPSSVWYEDLSPTLCTTHYGEPVVIYESDSGIRGERSKAVPQRGGYNDGKTMFTLNSVEVHGVVCEERNELPREDGDIESGSASRKL